MSSKQAQLNKERRQFWQMVIETWQNSGMSISKFCKAEGLSEGSFYNWRKRLSSRHSQQNKQSDSSPSAFIEVAIPKPTPSNSSGQTLSLSNGSNHAPIELVLCSGNMLRIGSAADSKTLSNVISALCQAGLC